MKNRAIVWLVGLILLAMLAGAVAALVGGEGRWKEAVPVSEVTGRVVFLDKERVFLVDDGGGGIVALSAIDPHLGHSDLWCQGSQGFEGAHGEKFDRLGRYFAGPAPRGLDRVAFKVEDGVVFVDPTEVTQGPGRGEERALDPAGPFCAPSTLATDGTIEPD